MSELTLTWIAIILLAISVLLLSLRIDIMNKEQK